MARRRRSRPIPEHGVSSAQFRRETGRDAGPGEVAAGRRVLIIAPMSGGWLLDTEQAEFRVWRAFEFLVGEDLRAGRMIHSEKLIWSR